MTDAHAHTIRAMLVLLALAGCAPTPPENAAPAPARPTKEIQAARREIASWLLTQTIERSRYITGHARPGVRPEVFLVSVTPTAPSAAQIAALQKLTPLPVRVESKPRPTKRERHGPIADAFVEFEGLGSATRQTVAVGLQTDAAHSWRSRLVVVRDEAKWKVAERIEHTPAPAWKGPLWRLKIKPAPGRSWGLDKVVIGGQLYYFFAYEVQNIEMRPLEVQLRFTMLTDRMKDGVDPRAVRPWKSFRGWKLPKQPMGERRIFDNSTSWALQKQVPDRPQPAVMPRIQEALERRFGQVAHTSQLRTLAPDARFRGVAIFTKVDPESDYLGIVVHGLTHPFRPIEGETYFEERVRLFRYHSPGSASHAVENPIIARRPAITKIIRRQLITAPGGKR